MFRFRARGVSSPSASTTPSHVTKSNAYPRAEIGPAALHLRDEMLKMYWAGVRRELPGILLSLETWQSGKHADPLPDEEDAHLHGYDTFVDQVSNTSRHFAHRYSAAKVAADTTSRPSYATSLQERGWDLYAQTHSASIKGEIRRLLDSEKRATSMQGKSGLLRRRAAMLLQAAQFLDIDKVIEYRRAEDLVDMSASKRPAHAQLAVVSYDETSMPVFGPQLCSECWASIRGPYFRSLQDEKTAVCEDCYMDKHYEDASFTKVHKHSILDEAVPPNVSQAICNCLTVQRTDGAGDPRALFPVDPNCTNGRHLNQEGKPGRPRCGLFSLTEMVAEAKFATTRLPRDKEVTLAQARLEHEKEVAERQKEERQRNPRTAATGTFPNAANPVATISNVGVEVYDEIPTSDLGEDMAHGNIHMALRFGPLLIENGVANTDDGALITSRDLPNLGVHDDATMGDGSAQYSLLVAGRSDRLVSSQNIQRSRKRYLAVMKQVVGGAFCGFLDQEAEDRIVDSLIAESGGVTEPTEKSGSRVPTEESVSRLLEELQEYLGPRVSTYIDAIASRLADPSVDLCWDRISNACPAFCDRLIDRDMFGPLLSQSTTSPLYLISFACRPDSNANAVAVAQTKHDVPPGHVQEYLAKLSAGHQPSSDLIDHLSAYWHDWACFPRGALYPNQDLLPWDCTSAYARYPVPCGECSLAKHAWAFPFDAWSLLTLHLARSPHSYPLNEEHWTHNRARVLLAHAVLLTAATAMARSPLFRAATTTGLSSTTTVQNSGDGGQGGGGDTGPARLGGIHRAQPASYAAERLAFHGWFVAPWAGLVADERRKGYESWRRERVERADVTLAGARVEDHGTVGWAAGGSVGLLAASRALAEDTCGSGCVSSEPEAWDSRGCGLCC